LDRLSLSLLNWWKDIVMTAVELPATPTSTWPNVTSPKEEQTRQLPLPVAARGNKGGACRQPDTGEATSWFVPPLVVPAFLVALIVARVAYQALV
jgi:hypothetical protein